jgi:hypothetical protein
MEPSDLRTELQELLRPQERYLVAAAPPGRTERRRTRLTAVAITGGLLLVATGAAAITNVSTGVPALDDFLGHEAARTGGEQRLADVQLAMTDGQGGEWVAAGFRDRDDPQVMCAAAALRSGQSDSPVGGATCASELALAASFERVGVRLVSGRSAKAAEGAASYPLFGLASGEVRSVALRDQTGRRWSASVSEVFAAVSPPPGSEADVIEPGSRLGRNLEVKAVLAVLPPAIEPESLVVETRLADGTVLKGHP